jgi:hypothetical protein
MEIVALKAPPICVPGKAISFHDPPIADHKIKVFAHSRQDPG